MSTSDRRTGCGGRVLYDLISQHVYAGSERTVLPYSVRRSSTVGSSPESWMDGLLEPCDPARPDSGSVRNVMSSGLDESVLHCIMLQY